MIRKMALRYNNNYREQETAFLYSEWVGEMDFHRCPSWVHMTQHRLKQLFHLHSRLYNHRVGCMLPSLRRLFRTSLPNHQKYQFFLLASLLQIFSMWVSRALPMIL